MVLVSARSSLLRFGSVQRQVWVRSEGQVKKGKAGRPASSLTRVPFWRGGLETSEWGEVYADDE